MMRRILGFLSKQEHRLWLASIFFLASCRQSNEPVQSQKVQLSKNIEMLMQNFINNDSSCQDCLYEIYFDKIDPHYSRITFYKGNGSLTYSENGRNGTSSVLYAQVLNKKVMVYTGAEPYFASKREATGHGKETPNSELKSNVWVVTDSLGTLKVDTLLNAYPFLPLPVKRKF